MKCLRGIGDPLAVMYITRALLNVIEFSGLKPPTFLKQAHMFYKFEDLLYVDLIKLGRF